MRSLLRRVPATARGAPHPGASPASRFGRMAARSTNTAIRILSTSMEMPGGHRGITGGRGPTDHTCTSYVGAVTVIDAPVRRLTPPRVRASLLSTNGLSPPHSAGHSHRGKETGRDPGRTIRRRGDDRPPLTRLPPRRAPSGGAAGPRLDRHAGREDGTNARVSTSRTASTTTEGGAASPGTRL